MPRILTLLVAGLVTTTLFAHNPEVEKGTPDIQSMSVLEFAPDGTLFIGDSKSAKIFCIRLPGSDTKPVEAKELNLPDLEGDLAGLLGTSVDNVLIHDMAVNPVSGNVYFSVSRGRTNWTIKWQLPNHLADAVTLIKLTPYGEFSQVKLENVEYSSVSIPNPIDADKEHPWLKGTKLRVDAITDLVLYDGNVYVTGMSNEEFSSTMWVAPYPFNNVSARSLEIYHGAHGKWETRSPIRTFLPYNLDGVDHMLAAYLCTPLVTFKLAELKTATHLKGKTVAEFGSGNYPLDMIVYQNNGRDLIMVSNSQLPLLIFDPKNVADFEGEILEEVQEYTAGIDFTARSGSGIQQLADYNEKVVLATQRMPSGKLVLTSLSKDWMIP